MKGKSETQDLPVIFIKKSSVLPDAHGQFLRLFQHSIEDAELLDQREADEFFTLTDSGRKGVFVATFSDRNELLSLLNLMPRLQPLVAKHQIVILVFARIMSRKIESVLEKSGCASVMRFETSARGFIYKLKRHVAELTSADTAARAALERARRAAKRGMGEDPPLQPMNPRRKSPEMHFRDLGNQVRLSPPLLTAYDFWLFRKTPYVRRYKGHWMIELIGPSPAAGKWRLTSRHESLFKGEEPTWEWGPRDEPGKYSEKFKTSPACWVFVGKKPEYSWVVNRWAFIGESPGLYLVENGEIIEIRFFETEEGLFDVSENSISALDSFKRIHDTYDQEHFLELERIEKKDMSITLDPPANLPWADRLDSAVIEHSAWKSHDLFREEGPEWGVKSSDLEELPNPPIRDPYGVEAPIEFQIPLGANAMRDCGIRALLKGEEIELLSYSEESPTLLIGTGAELKIQDPVSLTIRSENLSRNLDFNLAGVVSAAEKDETGRGVFTVILHSDSHQRLSQIRDAMERRQSEILEFFKKAKGAE